MNYIWISLIFILFLSIGFWYLVYRYIRKRLEKFFGPGDYSESIPIGSLYKRLDSYEDDKLEKLPTLLPKLEGKVQGIYLVHGTFVGDDPFQIYALLENILPEVGQGILQKLKEYTRNNQEFIARDLGNFTREHADILANIEKVNIPVNNFTWSSANHHIARVRGCLELCKELKQQKKGDQVLLIGHSHAGQIFCLISLMLNNKLIRNHILEHLSDDEKMIFQDAYPVLKTLKFDFVTLGTPVRYRFQLNNQMRLIHFINHRGLDPLGGSFLGVAQTKSGDYVQQWGVTGSDTKSPIKADQKINFALDEILGKGNDLKLMKENIKHRRRLHDAGKHFLVDYGDGSGLPNFFKTILGHGVYTRRKLLSFHFETIIKEWYH